MLFISSWVLNMGFEQIMGLIMPIPDVYNGEVHVVELVHEGEAQVHLCVQAEVALALYILCILYIIYYILYIG
jgi:hypothetical protein